jgi:hypothetical protein
MARTPFQQRCDHAWLAGRDEDLRFSIAVIRRDYELRQTTQTRLYVVHDASADAVKIGIGYDPKLRLSNLQIGSVRPLELILDVPAFAGLEKLVHHLLRRERIRGEWFSCSDRALVACAWLMAAEDFQRDALAMGDPFDADFVLGVLGSSGDEFLCLLEKDAA